MEVIKPLLSVLLAIIIGSNHALADILVFSIRDKHQIEGEFRDMPAKFGEPIKSDGIRGMVVYADPPQACKDIKGPPNVTNYAENWIVLIARFNCTFEDKVRSAQRAGYDAVIVHNVNSNELEPMSTKNPIGLLIPSVFVSEITGLIIRENYLYNRLYFVLINDDQPFNINTHLLLPFAIVVGICFLVMVIFMVVRCIKDRRRQRRHRLPNSSLKKIPTHKYTKGDPYETCAICLEDYAEGEKLRVLPCAHAYHTKCIDPWLTRNRRVCPCCKRKVFAADERVVTDSETDSDVDDATPLIRNGHSGTQGGTFTPQQENPFVSSERRSRERQNSDASESSSESIAQRVPSVIRQLRERRLQQLFDDADSYSNEEVTTPLLTVSDNHSINGKTSQLERSVSSTKPHTVTLYYDGQEHTLPIFHVPNNAGRSAWLLRIESPESNAPATSSESRSSA